MARQAWCVFAFALLLSSGISLRADSPKTDPVKQISSPKGIVYVIGGVGGCDALPANASFFLPLAGVRHEIRAYPWSHGFGQILKDLQDTRHLRRKAEILAEVIQAEQRNDPDRPIYLLAYSGGAGLALVTAELLPPQSLERVVLLAPAVSPEYDLRGALRATRHVLVSYHSPLDRFILHWGTWQFGTIDRFYTASAGCKGFTVPKDWTTEDRDLYKKLLQVRWEPRMMLKGNHGTHSGVQAPAFLMGEVAAWLKD